MNFVCKSELGLNASMVHPCSSHCSSPNVYQHSTLVFCSFSWSPFSFFSYSNFSWSSCQHSSTLCQEHPLHANFTVMILSLLSGLLHSVTKAGALAFLPNSGIAMPVHIYQGALLPWDLIGIPCLRCRVLVSTFYPPCSHRTNKHIHLQKAR